MDIDFLGRQKVASLHLLQPGCCLLFAPSEELSFLACYHIGTRNRDRQPTELLLRANPWTKLMMAISETWP
jgi:hypothetical protein